MTRDPDLQAFLDEVLAAFARVCPGAESRRSLLRIAELLETPVLAREGGGRRLPVCVHLGPALAIAAEYPQLTTLVDRFRVIEPRLEWKTRSSSDGSASPGFHDGHANVVLFGPGGLEDRPDMQLGASLIAPNVRYPDHDHPPEETYLVLSDSEFMHGGSDWFRPGINGSFYNVPGIRHAMRAEATPLFAFWALLPDQYR